MGLVRVRLLTFAVEFRDEEGRIGVMNSTFRFLNRGCLIATIAIISCSASMLMAQTNQTDAARWMAGAQIPPAFTVPNTKRDWEKKRKEVRAQLWELLGKLPPRPALPKVEILSREDRGDFVVEKFQFDNGAGATVPGYVLLPKQVSENLPPFFTVTGTADSTRSGRRSCFRHDIRPRLRGRRWPNAALSFWALMPIASERETAEGRAVRPNWAARVN